MSRVNSQLSALKLEKCCLSNPSVLIKFLRVLSLFCLSICVQQIFFPVFWFNFGEFCHYLVFQSESYGYFWDSGSTLLTAASQCLTQRPREWTWHCWGWWWWALSSCWLWWVIDNKKSKLVQIPQIPPPQKIKKLEGPLCMKTNVLASSWLIWCEWEIYAVGWGKGI